MKNQNLIPTAQKWQPVLEKGQFVIVRGQNKAQLRDVDIKIISKKDMTLTEIEELRQTIKLYKVTIHHGVVRLLDYFEHKDFLYLMYEREDLEFKKQSESQRAQ